MEIAANVGARDEDRKLAVTGRVDFAAILANLRLDVRQAELLVDILFGFRSDRFRRWRPGGLLLRFLVLVELVQPPLVERQLFLQSQRSNLDVVLLRSGK